MKRKEEKMETTEILMLIPILEWPSADLPGIDKPNIAQFLGV